MELISLHILHQELTEIELWPPKNTDIHNVHPFWYWQSNL